MATMQLELWDRVSQELPAAPREPADRVAAPPRAEREPRHEKEQRHGDMSPYGLEKEPRDGDLPADGSGRGQLLDSLRAKLSRIETGSRDAVAERISCGSPMLDQMLPGGGLSPGTLNEWVAESDGCGAGWLSLLAARGAVTGAEGNGAEGRGAEGRGRLVVIDGGESMRGGGAFYPPAAIAAGIPAEQIIVVRVSERGDFVWAADQALRSPAVAVVWGFLERLDDRDARRLQLAAETGRSTAMFLRPRAALREPSWAEVRWHVRGIPGASRQRLETRRLETRRFEDRGSGDRRLQARLVRCRGGRSGGSVILQIDSAGRLHHEHENSSNSRQAAALPLVAQLAHPAAANRALRRRA